MSLQLKKNNFNKKKSLFIKKNIYFVYMKQNYLIIYITIR